MKSPYQILGLKPTATARDIKLAHRALVKEIHPDRRPETGEFGTRSGYAIDLASINAARDQLLTKKGNLTSYARREKSLAAARSYHRGNGPRRRNSPTVREGAGLGRVVTEEFHKQVDRMNRQQNGQDPFYNVTLALNELLQNILGRVGGNDPAVKQTLRNMQREADELRSPREIKRQQTISGGKAKKRRR